MNNFRILAKKNTDFIWVFLFPLFFLLFCTFVCLIPAFPNSERTTYNVLLLILGILNGLLLIVNAIFIVVYLLKPLDPIYVSIDKIRIKKSKDSYIDYSFNDLKKVEYGHFLNKQESVIVFKFKDDTKKDLIVRYVLEADKVAKYLNQVLKNEKLS